MASMALREQALRLMRLVGAASCRCPAHSQNFSPVPRLSSIAKDHVEPECAFEVANSSIRYGEGVTREVGMDFENRGLKKVCVVTDQKLVTLPPVKEAIESLETNKVKYELFYEVRIEPTDASFKAAIDFAKQGEFDSFLAIGGGSVIDTAKAANLYLCHPENEFLDFVNAPVGKGMPIDKPLKPLIAIPTTAGTERVQGAKRLLLESDLKLSALPAPPPPTSGQSSGSHPWRSRCHAIESYTAIPYQKRGPRPPNPNMRPAYQGSNPVSDVWSKHALGIVAKYLKRSIKDASDLEARSNMHLASVYAGVGFGNAGVHLCHGMSYPISGLVKSYKAKDYEVDHPLVPHGLSVIMTSPAVFRFTAPPCPERHLEAAQILGKLYYVIRVKVKVIIPCVTIKKRVNTAAGEYQSATHNAKDVRYFTRTLRTNLFDQLSKKRPCCIMCCGRSMLHNAQHEMSWDLLLLAMQLYSNSGEPRDEK
ncbi:hydroxyacid-oxoacid transhydrogenase, mitochondrial-like [Stylophora pistillata]|uniref:hydroxyacid-oxoacid transhydrogenase, mitochondrial-like n=1 Tax=Stylophora pistillata TaxID=50429 RepID=UPI000C03B043|nr:hydroxyacid-oxoacid transhydrogenase, mitochondrial-like [Stylophora pistillata]